MTENIDYESLAVLAAVVREGSFDGAARSMNVTQSAVSQRIRQLESKVGTMLIIRGRPCVPTETGQALCQHYDEVVLLQHELKSRLAAEGQRSAQAARIRIAVNSDSLATWFPSVVRRAAEELNILFEISHDDQDHTEQAIRSGEALAVVTANYTPIHGCKRISLGAMEYLAVASPDFVSRHLPDGPTLSALAAAPCIFFDRKDTLPEQWLEKCFDQVERPPAHLVPSYEGYLSCLVNGTGWGMMPMETTERLIRKGRLVELIEGKRICISLHWQSAAQTSEILRLLSELVQDEARKLLIPDSYTVIQETA
jgi:LysR family transcriptional regulator (chromosome initiation inhibitor)